MNLTEQRRALVLGLGASGVAAARLLRHHGWVVSVADEKADPKRISQLFPSDGQGVDVVERVETCSAADIDQVVVSPGIAHEHRWLQHVRSLGVPVIPEFELGLAWMPGIRVIAVTGTNGKSSLVKWIAAALVEAGLRAVPAGNYGVPPSELALSSHPPEVVVLELSSFQLEQATSFKPEVAVLLNLSPNHLDRHPTMEAYTAAKAKLFAHMGRADHAVVHAPVWPDLRDRCPPELAPVRFDAVCADGFGFDGGWVTRNGARVVDLRGTWWGRFPLGVNAAAGVAALTAFDVPVAAMESSARGFVPLAHRMELFAELNGIRFINDSKASTMSALAAAVGSGTTKKHLIAGGILKERDVNFVKETLAKNCVFVYCIGQASQKLVDAWSGVVPCEQCGELENAVRLACRRAKAGEEILLSPGCSSFDQFASYAQRGEKFKQWVQLCTNETITRKE
jgi:UDP-N-acetylmuramoylalanine--D-glutamate ligase